MNDPVIVAMVGVFATLIGAFLGAAGAIYGAKITIKNSNEQLRIENNEFRKEQLASHKKSIIADLISYRFVLTDGGGSDVVSVMHFNAALSRVPVWFSHNKHCMDLYRGISRGFTAEKYYFFVKALMDDVPLSSEYIDQYLIETVPYVHFKQKQNQPDV